MAYSVLQVGSSLRDWGGIERFVVYLADGLSARGVDVSVTCPISSPLDERLTAGTRIPMNLADQFSTVGLAAYMRLFKKRKFDVIHVHFSPDYVMPTMAARLTRQPCVIMSRHVAVPWSKAKANRYMKLVDHIVPVSDAVKRQLLESGVPAEKMTVAKAGVPTPEFLGEVPTERKDGVLRVGSFSRLVKEKGIDVLIEAAYLAEGVEVVIYGDGPEKSSLRQLAGGRVEMPGKVNDVAMAMAACDVVVVPSTWEEAFPYAVLEAFSVGRPVIASRIGGLPELVKPAATGYLFQPGNPTALAVELSKAKADRGQLRTMGERARAVHRSEYTVEKMAERFDTLYQRLMARAS